MQRKAYHTLKLALTLLFLVSVNLTAHAQNNVLWYTKPADKWTAALPIGNGRIGGMVFGGTDVDHIQFNEETLWTGRPRNYNKSGASKFLPAIRELLAENKQKEAEILAQANFMGMQSEAGDREAWIKRMRAGEGITGNAALSVYDDKSWKLISVPSYEGWETVGLDNFDGSVWLRTTFDVPASWKGKELILDLNRIRDEDFTYVNGKLIGHTATTEPRTYHLPAALIKPGRNVIAIQVLNYFDKGGIAGYKDTTRKIGIYPVGSNVQNGISLVKKWKYKIQNARPPAVAQYQASYQPFGDIFLRFDQPNVAVSNYKRSLDLETAIANTTYTFNGVNYSRSYFVSEPDQCLVIRLTASRAKSISFTAELASAHLQQTKSSINGHTIAISVQVKDGALHGESRLTAVLKNGSSKMVDGRLVINGADEVTLYLVAATNFVNDSDVSGNPTGKNKEKLKHLTAKTYNDVKNAHLKEYQSYFNRFSIDLGRSAHSALPTDERIAAFSSTKDPALVALYVQYGRYLLISSSRPGSQPANLQGIWNDLLSPPWGSKYTTNINLEMNYWPSEVLNLSALNEPLFSKIKALSRKGTETAKAYYDAKGWVLHHNTDLWNGTAPINASNHGIWVTGGAWLSLHLWEHYQFTLDKKFLQTEAYPIMKSAAEFFVDFLVEDKKTGWLISTPSNSPENGGLVAGPAMDHQIIRSLFKSCIEGSEILGLDESFRKMLKQKLTRLAPNQIGKYGQLQEWLEDKDDTTNKHRHVSHLWGIYPGNDITWEINPSMMNAARRSLLYRGDEATGWSLAWKINFWARFKDGEHAMKMIKMLLKPASTNGAGSYVNLFDAHPPFQIDGNFGGAAGVAEMILQSHEDYIELLPALPVDLPFGVVNGICARGGFELSLKWENGRLSNVDVFSKAGGTCILKYKGKTIRLATIAGSTYNIKEI